MKTKICLLLLGLLAGALYLMTDIAVAKASIPSTEAQSAPINLKPGKGLYAIGIEILADSQSLQGAVDVNLEGVPGMNYSLFTFSGVNPSSASARPELESDKLRGLAADHPLTLWVLIQPKPPGPKNLADQAELPSCCLSAGKLERSSIKAMADLNKPLRLTFRHSTSHKKLLTIPLQIGDRPAVLPVQPQISEKELELLFVNNTAAENN